MKWTCYLRTITLAQIFCKNMKPPLVICFTHLKCIKFPLYIAKPQTIQLREKKIKINIYHSAVNFPVSGQSQVKCRLYRSQVNYCPSVPNEQFLEINEKTVHRNIKVLLRLHMVKEQNSRLAQISNISNSYQT